MLRRHELVSTAGVVCARSVHAELIPVEKRVTLHVEEVSGDKTAEGEEQPSCFEGEGVQVTPNVNEEHQMERYDDFGEVL